ncbi:DUF3795 domain-containing protein [Desulfoscipio gibsoniae]|uniref:DUF3795 domain-containing protein n=1 Tax=Desulfoscipio gibsoniae DSM 7213 TaxID=767817 RepID=R4K9G3_9FIRM|nr:DUF3795 domain-containing protein [Desulfoscipio gibsoniae]AGK99807.1 hypothetical protein Desgi_0205 [Desulfoscipio gibsoniae DSM 7213]
MKVSDDITLVAPCGTYCGDCGAYRVKDDPSLQEVVAERLQRVQINWNGVPCPGCRPSKGKCPLVDGVCATYACVTEHDVDFCFECPEFPCAKLNPAADRAEILNHNIKVFYLCCIKHQGLAKFLKMIPEIRQRYYNGKMAIGKGPQLE